MGKELLMSAANTANWIRAGLLTLPVYGLLTFWVTFTQEPDRQNQVEAYARMGSRTQNGGSWRTSHIRSARPPTLRS
jgi:hypothetical protein